MKRLFIWLLVWQVVILTIGTVAFQILPLSEQYLGGATQTYIEDPLLFSRANFDGNHYLSIAAIGYSSFQHAFFPLYPTLIRFISQYNHHAVIAGIGISLLSFVFGIAVLYKLLKLDETPSVARWTIAALLLFPTSFFFSFVYTEGLFFFLLVSSLFAARKGHLLTAALLGALASYCRVVGVFIFPVILYELYVQKMLNVITILQTCIIPLGLMFYMFQLNQMVHDPLAFVHVQTLFDQGRSTQIILPYQVFWRYTKMLATVDRELPLYKTIILEMVTGITFFFLTFVTWLKMRKSYAFLTSACLLLPTLTGTFTSVPRYVLICFPAFILIGRFLARSDIRQRYAYIISNIVLMIVYLTLFTVGHWVA